MRLFSLSKKHIFPAFLSLVLIAGCLGCQSSQAAESTTASESSEVSTEEAGIPAVEKVLTAILECPNEKLTPVVYYISLDESAPADAKEQEANKKAETEAWKEAVGDCFQEENFTYFMENYNGRTDFQMLAERYSLSISIVQLEAEELEPQTEKANATQRFTATICLENAEGKQQECVTKWKVTYDTEHPELIYTLGIVDDGGVWKLAEEL